MYWSAGSAPRAVPAAVIRSKAEDAVLESAALERMWGTRSRARSPGGAGRMAAHSQAPDVLAELWRAGESARRAGSAWPARWWPTASSTRPTPTTSASTARSRRVRHELEGITTAEALKASSGEYHEVNGTSAQDARRKDASRWTARR
jgi:hypothetical protein